MTRKSFDLTPEEWQARLTPEQYRVLREKGTEAAFTGEYHDHKQAGVFRCAACHAPLFHSSSKFDSGTGWPSFTQTIDEKSVEFAEDRHLPTAARTEVLCHRCHSHLGHVFDDGPAPTGKRFCINSVALNFLPKNDS